MDKLERIHKRQLARLLDHLKETNQYTPDLERDLKRSFGFTFQDIRAAIEIKHGQDKDNNYERQD